MCHAILSFDLAQDKLAQEKLPRIAAKNYHTIDRPFRLKINCRTLLTIVLHDAVCDL